MDSATAQAGTSTTAQTVSASVLKAGAQANGVTAFATYGDIPSNFVGVCRVGNIVYAGDGTTIIKSGTTNASEIITGTLDVARLPTLTKAMVGLSNVDNTSDLSKPASTATLAAQAAAEAARDAALIQAGVYTTEALGRAAVADGQAFKVQGTDDVAAYEYRRTNSTTSVLIATYPSSAAFSNLKTSKVDGLPSKNKFNIATITPATSIGANGTVYTTGTYTTYSVSDYIPVVAGTSYVANGSIRFSCYYNANKAVVAGGIDANGVTSFTVPTGVGVAYVRISVLSSIISTFQLEIGTVSTIFSPYLFGLDSQYLPTVSPITTVNRIAIASKNYVAAGSEIAIYQENIVYDYPAYKGRIGISFTGAKETCESTKITPTNAQIGASITVTTTIASPTYATDLSKTTAIIVSDPAVTTPANLQHIGDSITGRMTWVNVINGTAAATGLTFSGNRTGNTAAVLCEGQSGWRMSNYFTVDSVGNLSPFMQPVTSPYLYYGLLSFWIDANSAAPSGGAGYFSTIKGLFNSTTGYKISPNVNDVMGTSAGVYVVWNGSAWVSIASETLGGFAFNYTKYRAAWSIPSPNIMHVLLGTNDFYGATELTFAALYADYKTNYDALIASVKADTPTVKIIVAVPPSSGRQGKHGTLTTEKVKRAMYLLADKLNTDYGGREVENIYILDYHSIMDRFYGFTNTYEIPFSTYTGAVGDGLYKSDITHPSSDGFSQMGKAYMGLIQYLR
jgi:hypothetical protein